MKIIFAHNCHNRINTLKKTINIEKSLFPESQSYICFSREGGIDINLFSEFKNIDFCHSVSPSWQRGCINAFYSILGYIESKNKNQDGVVVFSHDDVRIVLKENVCKKINQCQSYDFVARRPIGNWGTKYLMMDAVFINLKSLSNIIQEHKENLIKHENEIPKDLMGSYSAEVWLHNFIGKKRGLIINYEHSSTEEYCRILNDEFGFEHVNAGKTGWKE